MTESWKKWEGQVVDGKFHLRQYLGESDHSGVFLTEHGEPEAQKAAIKFVPADSGSADLQLSRWEKASNLSHPNLTRIFQTGRCQLGDERLLYVVMEYGEEDLSQIIPQRSLTPAETQDMLGPVLSALGYLHGEGFVHGAVKPSNIMAIGDQLRISSDRICEAGQKKIGRGQASPYDAPEAATRGQFPAGDVWSLGVTLVEILTQQLPTWEWKGQQEAVLPKALPAPFLEIARHCLRSDPQVRWTVKEINARLQPDAVATHDAPSAKSERASARRRYAIGIGIFALVVVLIARGSKMINRGVGAPQATAVASVSSTSQQIPALPAAAPPVPVPSSPEKTAENQPTASAAAASAPPVVPETRVDTKKSMGSRVKGDVVHQALPDVPPSARETIQGTVRIGVRVQVDSSGSVTGIDLESPGPSKYFANLAMKAARDWKFTAAKVGDENVASEWMLRFYISQDGTKVTPSETSP